MRSVCLSLIRDHIYSHQSQSASAVLSPCTTAQRITYVVYNEQYAEKGAVKVYLLCINFPLMLPRPHIFPEYVNSFTLNLGLGFKYILFPNFPNLVKAFKILFLPVNRKIYVFTTSQPNPT